MRVPTTDKNRPIVNLLLFRHTFNHLHLLVVMQADQHLQNLPLEIEPKHLGVREFIPLHALVLEDETMLRRLNLPYS